MGSVYRLVGIAFSVVDFGCTSGCVIPLVSLVAGVAIIVLHIMCIYKAFNGQRFLVPGISEYANRF